MVFYYHTPPPNVFFEQMNTSQNTVVVVPPLHAPDWREPLSSTVQFFQLGASSGLMELKGFTGKLTSIQND